MAIREIKLHYLYCLPHILLGDPILLFSKIEPRQIIIRNRKVRVIFSQLLGKRF